MDDSKDPKGLRKQSYTTAEVDTFVRRALERQEREASRRNFREDVGRISHDELLETAREAGLSADDLEAVIAEEMKIRAARAEVEAMLRAEQAARAAERRKAGRGFVAHLAAFVAGGAILFVIDRLTSGGTWFYWPLLLWVIGLAAHAVRVVFPKDDVEAVRAAAKAQSEAEKRAAQLEEVQRDRRARVDEAYTTSPRGPKPLAGQREEPRRTAEDEQADARATQRR